MFDDGMIMFAAMGMGAISVGVIMYLLLDSILSGSQKVEKQKRVVAG